MTIELERAKQLKRHDMLVVTKTQQLWEVIGVTLNRDPRKVTIKINNGRMDSFIDENRLHLFDEAPIQPPAGPTYPNLPSADDMVASMRADVEAAYKEVQTEAQAASEPEAAPVEPEVEPAPEPEPTAIDNPELEESKPAKKSRRKKAE